MTKMMRNGPRVNEMTQVPEVPKERFPRIKKGTRFKKINVIRVNVMKGAVVEMKRAVSQEVPFMISGRCRSRRWKKQMKGRR